MTQVNVSDLQKTVLYDLHVELGGRMVPFAGYSMPVQYSTGIVKEHTHTREGAGLFDVSHMGQVRISGAKAAYALESLTPIDVVDLAVGKQRYALFTNDSGGVMDDLMVANLGSSLFVVVNAVCKEQDISHLKSSIGESCHIEVLSDRSLLAIQGPKAAAVMARLVPELASMTFMTVKSVEILGAECIVSRSGYTGEDGYEVSIPSDKAQEFARELLKHEEVKPVGLGARDSLRLEAGLCLYGHDLDAQTSPVESSMLWALSKARRTEGTRPGGYPGAEKVLKQIKEGVSQKRVGLLPREKMPVREGAELFDEKGNKVGIVTSGGFGPTLNGPCAMGYVQTAFAQPGTFLKALVRGKHVSVEVAKTPFVPQRYYRG